MNGTCPLSFERICFTRSLGGQLRCFQLFYAHKALWERASLCPYKFIPPILQTSTYYLPQPKVHQPISLIQALYSLHFLYTGCFWLIKFCSRGCRKTNTHTYIQTNKHTHNTFLKTILVNQMHAHSRPLAGCGCAPGLSIITEN